MKWDCVAVDDAISDWARGIELPEGARLHIAQCPACAKALEEAKAFSRLVLSADCVPDSPDCRSAVMARLPKPRSAWRFAWAAVPMAIVLAAIMLVNSRHQPAPQQVVKQQPVVQQQAPAPPPVIVPETPKPATIAETPKVRRVHHRRAAVRPKRVPPPAPKESPVEQPPEQVCVVKPSEPDTQPVAMVYVTWDEPNLDQSYKCMVTESEPQTMPEQNGGTNNETNRGI
ncbi:MAG TPA: hypothetical protein VFI02_15585 [Armatimonadota bacterium]|nr:hypothetical protein [Armatimonadota bacterium]